jgi:acyl-CoA oxidase
LNLEAEMQEIEALAAGLKTYSTWSTTAILQECREVCGVQGIGLKTALEH